jgi:hypothetical protein
LLEKFFTENKTDTLNLSFFKSVPLKNILSIKPKDIRQEFEDTESDKDALEKWGCGWDCDNIEIEKIPDRYIYRFDTPLQPPLTWLEKTSIQYPEIQFEMESEELFGDYFLDVKIKNGNRIHYEQKSLSENFKDISGQAQTLNDLVSNIKNTNYLLETYMNKLDELVSSDKLNHVLSQGNLDKYDSERDSDEEDNDDDVEFNKFMEYMKRGIQEMNLLNKKS